MLAVVATLAHLAALPLVAGLGIGWRQLVIPFTRADSAHAQACGVLAVDLLVAVTVTSWLRRRLAWRWWRRVHALALPLFALATAHGLLAGSTAGRWILASLLAALATGALVIRLRRNRTAAPEQPDAPLRLLIRATAWRPTACCPWNSPTPRARRCRGGNPARTSGSCCPAACGATTRSTATRPTATATASPCSGSPGPRLHGGAHHPPPRSPPRRRRAPQPLPLVDAPAYVFVAGGIGITPLLPMIRHVRSRPRPWHLVYLGRNPRTMAFLPAMHALDPRDVTIRFSDHDGITDLTDVIATAPRGAAVYSCGPESLLTDLSRLVATRPDLTLHVERFAATTPTTPGAACDLELRRTGAVVHVPPDRTLLEVVRTVRPDVPAHCKQGVCGSCRVTVLTGQPDHRDTLLTDHERAAGAMLLCVSRARTGSLTLDL
ncbi:flavin reductase family protein [Actinokineospora soli]|uniref:Flavin reductase family protein n=1 Tax=Actinokineospora soli TaxID=1048753 RepID=A0ABW2TNT2_9PSEU